MKKIVSVSTIIIIAVSIFAQAPQRLSYQAVIRNSSGGLVVSHAVGIKISILQGSATGTAVYVETHTTTTNANGLATIEIGGGSVVSGTFATINWASGTYYLKTETDPAGGSSYTIVGTSQLLSVPYALYAMEGGELTLPYNGTVASAGAALSLTNSLNHAIQGIATSTSGTNYGVIGKTLSTSGRGVDGSAEATSGTTYGVYGVSASPTGYGVYGSSPNYGVYGSGKNGVFGITTSGEANASAVYGFHNNVTGVGYGVFGISVSSSGSGVRGVATNTSGATRGVYGETRSSSGHSIHGQSTNAGGFSGYFDGGKVYINGRTGIGTTAPEAGLHLKGAGWPESFMYLQANTSQDAGFRLYEGTTARWSIFCDGATDGLQIYNTAGTTAIFCDQTTANVGIGRTDPGFDLDVYGNIRATGSVYYGSSPAVMYNKPDYVFGRSYEFMKTEEVEEFLEKEKHLPWITSAEKEKKENGDVINMTRMAFETVESVENMQLQIIEQNKLIRKIQAENERLKSENADITLRLEKLEAIISK